VKALARGMAVGLWAGFFWWLWLSGEAARYVGPRTAWVVPFGAIALLVVAVAQLTGVRRGARDRVGVREVLGLLALVAPIAAVALIPAPFLGALAVHRKSGTRALAIIAAGTKPPQPGAALSVFDVASASASAQYATAAGIRDGRKVKLLGIVTGKRADGSFDLSRFKIVCCAADAIPYTVHVKATQAVPLKEDSWALAAGEIWRNDDGAFELVADHVAAGDAPSNPYSS
jgi:uncharacterized repeat protein (TIGR03943 family)